MKFKRFLIYPLMVMSIIAFHGIVSAAYSKENVYNCPDHVDYNYKPSDKKVTCQASSQFKITGCFVPTGGKPPSKSGSLDFQQASADLGAKSVECYYTHDEYTISMVMSPAVIPKGNKGNWACDDYFCICPKQNQSSCKFVKLKKN